MPQPNTQPLNLRLLEVAEHAYCLLDGRPDLHPEADDNEKEYWASVPDEDITLASNWTVLRHDSGETLCRDLLMIVRKAYEEDFERVSPYPGGPCLETEFIKTTRIHGTDDNILLWRDVCITWYQYPNRCTCTSRLLTKEELVQFEQELRDAMAKQ